MQVAIIACSTIILLLLVATGVVVNFDDYFIITNNCNIFNRILFHYQNGKKCCFFSVDFVVLCAFVLYVNISYQWKSVPFVLFILYRFVLLMQFNCIVSVKRKFE